MNGLIMLHSDRRSSACAVARQGSGLVMANQIDLFCVPQPPDIRCAEGDQNEPSARVEGAEKPTTERDWRWLVRRRPAGLPAVLLAVTPGGRLGRGAETGGLSVAGYRRTRGRMPSTTVTSCAVLSGTCLCP
jgi:hypothetical protein